MLVKDTSVTITWDIEKTPDFATYDSAYFDLQIRDPDDITTYFEGTGAWAALFTQPTASTNGTITLNQTFTKKGVWEIILSTGTSSNFTILDTNLYVVIEETTAISHKLNFN